MEAMLAGLIGLLTAGGIYLVLRRRSFPVILGLHETLRDLALAKAGQTRLAAPAGPRADLDPRRRCPS